MIRAALSLLLAVILSGCGGTSPGEPAAADNVVANAAPVRAPEPLPDKVRVRIETAAGPIVVELDARRAPLTAANFVRYAEEGRFDGTSFYRAAPSRGAPDRGFIQGGIRRNYRRMLPPIAHEPTNETGIRHVAGAISMARGAPGSAMGEFFITSSAMPSMDADDEDPGYAAFGRVVEGMDVVRRILAAPRVPNAGSGSMRGQMLADPVDILRARRAG